MGGITQEAGVLALKAITAVAIRFVCVDSYETTLNVLLHEFRVKHRF